MEPIKKLDQLVEYLIKSGIKKKIAVANAQDSNTIGALSKAVDAGFVHAIMVGSKVEIEKTAKEQNIDPTKFEIIDKTDETDATIYARDLVKNDKADVFMKGLIGTDKFLKAVLDKENGLLPPKAIMSYVAAIEVPNYHKLLFVTDTAVLPNPDIKQKVAMLNYSITMANKMGIKMPKVALIGASEKVSENFPNSIDYAIMCKMVERRQTKPCIIDGPLDVFLACDKESVKIKGVKTPINGDADVLLFPSLEACNSFYKGLMLFGNGNLAGLIQGTLKPVVVMSRSESSKSKFYCVALSCIMSENENN